MCGNGFAFTLTKIGSNDSVMSGSQHDSKADAVIERCLVMTYDVTLSNHVRDFGSRVQITSGLSRDS